MDKDDTCWDCKHLTSAVHAAPPVLCKAFPDEDGIPLEIVSGDVRHDRLLGNEAEPVFFEKKEG